MLSQYNLRGAIHVCVVKRIPLALAFAILLLAFPAFGAERGVERTTLSSPVPVATPYLAGQYRALVRCNGTGLLTILSHIPRPSDL